MGDLIMWKELYICGATGSEGGVIFKDEEYKESCRITLGKCPKYYAITCGVYGAMMHTAFCDFENYDVVYESMKKDLQEFIDKDLSEDEASDFFEEFTTKY